MRVIEAILKNNPDGSRVVVYHFEQSSLEDNQWYVSLEEMGNMFHAIYRAEDDKYKPRGGRGGEFCLDYLCERARGASHEEIRDRYFFKR
jgi:hypothetical protein